MGILQKEKLLQVNINHDLFIMLLNGLKIEAAIEMFMNEDVRIYHNTKHQNTLKKTWLRYLKRTILNKYTKIVQFKVENIDAEHGKMAFKIFMICRKLNGTFNFTEVYVNHSWKDNFIKEIQYKLINH